MTTPHLIKTRGNGLNEPYTHARNDFTPCFTVSEVNQYSNRICYEVDLPLKVTRGGPWGRACDIFSNLSRDTTFGKVLTETLSMQNGVTAHPDIKNSHRVLVWVDSDTQISPCCKRELRDILMDMPDTLWISIEYAIHRHESFGRRISEFIGRL